MKCLGIRPALICVLVEVRGCVLVTAPPSGRGATVHVPQINLLFFDLLHQPTGCFYALIHTVGTSSRTVKGRVHLSDASFSFCTPSEEVKLQSHQRGGTGLLNPLQPRSALHPGCENIPADSGTVLLVPVWKSLGSFGSWPRGW